MARPLFLMWYDDNPRIALSSKVEAAIEAYVGRFQAQPNVVLVNEADLVERTDILVRGVSHIRRNNIWVGREEIEETPVG